MPHDPAVSVCGNCSRVHISLLRKEKGEKKQCKEIALDVEICRTVFEDNPERMVYNVHK